ncbi:tetratricopeptide repeat protein [Candidatus Pelagisphaera phototrophica]|uniref:tetratricopeptide repeat protein n=1 Tax=Candidatus Pelagisphaera phototrophica TaxID=2684113 RepID=UPI0024B7F925|nr:tetratricopeptide repeat protein [Candidatus Pelagisphaera phototrophica]
MCSVSSSGWAETFEEIKEWAEQGHDFAQHRLGMMYAKGEGVPQDSKEAVRWYTKAAEQGIASAQNNLGFSYAKGQGVLQDYVRSHMWYNIAAANGYEDGPKNRDIVAEEMTSDQIAEAQKMAREMVEANPKLMGE